MNDESMRVIELSGFGGPEVLSFGSRPVPRLQHGEVLIQIAAIGFNRADVSQREGRYPPPEGASDLLGLECSGIVTAVGVGASRYRVGDRVCALLAGGGYAEFVAVPEVQVLPVPSGMELVEAAGLVEVAATVLSNFAQDGAGGLAAPGTSVLVHGGSGGLGTFAVQFAVALGWRVFATAGSKVGVEHCLDLGAVTACNYREADFEVMVDQQTDGGGVDLILDMVGGSYLEKNLRSLAFDGRLMIVATLGGAEAVIDLRHMMRRRLTVQATTLRARPTTGPNSKAAVLSQVERVIWPMISARKLRPRTVLRMPFDEVRHVHEAHAAHSLPPGKVVMVIQPGLD